METIDKCEWTRSSVQLYALSSTFLAPLFGCYVSSIWFKKRNEYQIISVFTPTSRIIINIVCQVLKLTCLFLIDALIAHTFESNVLNPHCALQHFMYILNTIVYVLAFFVLFSWKLILLCSILESHRILLH